MGFLVLRFQLDLLAFAGLMIGLQVAAHFWVRRRTAQQGLRVRAHLGIVLLTLTGLAIALLSSHWERLRLRDAVSSLAPTYADELSRMGHEKITVDTAPDDPTYLALIDMEKRWLKSNGTVADIYTFGKLKDGKIVLLVDSETDYNHNGVYDEEREQRTPIGEPYDEDASEINRAFAGENVWMDTPTEDRWGAWVSCFVPLRNARGEVTAVLGVDYPAEDWIQSILFSRCAALGLAAVAGIIVLSTQVATALGRAESRKLEAETGGDADVVGDSVDAATEGQRGGWQTLKRNRAIALVTAIALLATVAARYIVLEDSLRVARRQFDAEWHENFERTQSRVEDTFALTYDALRTIASLPGVQRIERHARGFEGDPKFTVQALYNNIASHVAVSEIHIVPADLDPDQIDPKTGKPGEPIATFDEIIVGKDAAHDPARAVPHEGEAHLDEIEIFEYRQMKQQNSWFQEHFPTRASIKGLDFPCLSSEEVITCDNSEFSARDLAADNDAPRKGIVYSVPFYDESGRFKGMISATIRTQALARLLKDPEFTLRRTDPPCTIAAASGIAVSHEAPVLQIKDATQTHDSAAWLLQCDVPPAVFESHPMVAAARARANLTTFTGISITLPLAGLIWSLMATRRRAIRLAGKMTAELRQSEARTKAIIDGALDAVVNCDAEGRIVTWNPQARAIFGWQESEILLRPMFATLFAAAQEDPQRRDLLSQLVAGETNFQGRVELLAIDREHRIFPAEVAIASIRGSLRCAFIRDISDLKKAEAERVRLNARLVDASHAAGKAEIATGVLHNVGNVLNSVNIAASVIAEKIASPEAAELAQASRMLRSHRDDLATYITQNEAGRHVPEYVAVLAECVSSQHHELNNEIRQLTAGIEHIKEIVRAQQQFSRGATLAQAVHPAEIIDAAISLKFASAANRIQIERDIQTRGKVHVDKHKLLQILVNLLANALQAVDPGTGKIIIRVTDSPYGGSHWQVIDNGIGIPSEILSRIFQHGFTTKKEGHGFGLHSCANAAAEMGGTLRVQSEGAGRGATFTLELPPRKPEEIAT